MSSPEPIRVIVLYMIKNESRIITRSIQSALKIADAICVSDTGSTDNTVQILKDFYPTLPIPACTSSGGLKCCAKRPYCRVNSFAGDLQYQVFWGRSLPPLSLSLSLFGGRNQE